MKKKPERLPACTIEADSRPPFSVRWEELMGWFLIPRLGEKLTWGMYEIPSRRCTYVYEMRVTGKATVHGVEGVELTAKETPCTGKKETIRRTFVAQLTPTHCRYLAVVRTEGDVRRYLTFLDGDAFLSNWGFGEDNCGNEIQLTARGDIRRDGAAVTSAPRDFLVDIVGRAAVTVGGKIHDTVCVMNIEKRGCDVISEQYLDREGKTVLWRRFNRDDWAFDHYGRRWSELLPDNERITVNGATYVHWYDCITDRVL